jgi:hypothetical protein
VEIWGVGGVVLFIRIYFQNGFEYGVMFFSILFVKLFSLFGNSVNVVLFHSVKLFTLLLVVQDGHTRFYWVQLMVMF